MAGLYVSRASGSGNGWGSCLGKGVSWGMRDVTWADEVDVCRNKGVALAHQPIEVLFVGAWRVKECLPDQVEQLEVSARKLVNVGGKRRRWQLGQKSLD